MDEQRWPTYVPRELVLDQVTQVNDHGSPYVSDPNGTTYLDAVGGIGCTPLGHGHPTWVRAISQQLEKLAAAANPFWTSPQQALATKLAQLAPISDGKVFLCTTGTEATEAALKVALKSTGRDVVIAFQRAFHGRTLGAIALTANENYRAPYVNCLEENHSGRFAQVNVVRVRYNDLEQTTEVFKKYGERIAAVFVEPVQGEAGVYPATKQFLLGLRELCSQYGSLLGLDEIQSGCGRTGSFTAWTTIVGNDPKVQPDIIWLAKALGGGVPVGACVARGDLAAAMTPGTHGTTFGGNPVACVAALTTLELLEKENLYKKAAEQIVILKKIAETDPIAQVTEIRGYGAMIGIQIGQPKQQLGKPLAKLLQQKGLLVTVCGGHTVRWLFPYRVNETELGKAWELLKQVVN